MNCSYVVKTEDTARMNDFRKRHYLDEPLNPDSRLREEVHSAAEARRAAGLEGLVGGLATVVINAEPDRQKTLVAEFLAYTGYNFDDAFEDGTLRTCVLKAPGSADVLVQARMQGKNPFAEANRFPKALPLPNTRLETFVFETPDLDAYLAIQCPRGVQFLTQHAIRTEHASFIQTTPSLLTGNSTGFVQWTGTRGHYRQEDSQSLDWTFEEPDRSWLGNIGLLDHTATRVRAENRDPAIVEFMGLTNYDFAFAVYVDSLNSITNVARLEGSPFAMVFTSGIHAYISDEESGPTERFIHNYGPRVHHMAFRTDDIEATFAALHDDGLQYLSDLEGSSEEGLKQAFSQPSPNSMLVSEYIHRYPGFDGFFTQHNVALLTEATARQ